MQKGLVVSKVLDGSIAKELEIVSGDRILEIDGTEVEDIIDFEYLCSDEEFIMYIEKTDGEIWELEIDKMPEEYLGIIVEEVSTNGLKVCKNNCIFCFVNQMPEGMRKSLYDKDDDYRLSATQGCYITLSNLSEEEFQRIERLHIGPLYISVHAWDPEVRKTLMINPATANISVQIQRLVKAGLTIHTQIVVVPGYNDGKVLKETVENLALLYPSVQSIGVVPVGLTKYRSGLPEIRPLDSEEAKNILEEGEKWQRYYRNTTGKNLVYFSDEFYVLSGKKFPRVIEYDDFYQIENGIGMASKFSEDINSIWSLIPKKITPRRVHIITGVSAANYFRFWKNKLSFIEGLSIIVHEIVNNYFGTTVTVAGLLTARDIVEQTGDLKGDYFLIPSVMLRAGENIFLDNYGVDWLEKQLNGKAVVIENEAKAFIDGVLGICLGGVNNE